MIYIAYNLTYLDCVEGLCRCSSRPRLPVPEGLTAKIISTSSVHDDERSYMVLWSYPPLHDVEDVTLILRIERADNILGLGAVYRKIREFRHKAEPGPNRFQQAVHNLGIKSKSSSIWLLVLCIPHFLLFANSLDARSNYRIRVAAYDSHHCEGHFAELYLNSNLLFRGNLDLLTKLLFS